LPFIPYLRKRREETFIHPGFQSAGVSSEPESREVQGFFRRCCEELYRQASSAVPRNRLNTASESPPDAPGSGGRGPAEQRPKERRRRGGQVYNPRRFPRITGFFVGTKRQAQEAIAELSTEELLALNSALEKLARMNPRHAQMVDLEFFAGQNMAEVAQALDVARTTVERDRIAVKAWLAKEMRGSR
jgi:hypothetical protein